MNNVQVMMASTGTMEGVMSAASRLNKSTADLTTSSSTSFKERLDQANRRQESLSSTETEEQVSSSEVTDQDDAAQIQHETKPKESLSSTSTADDIASEQEVLQDSQIIEQAEAADSSSMNNMLNVVMMLSDISGGVAQNSLPTLSPEAAQPVAANILVIADAVEQEVFMVSPASQLSVQEAAVSTNTVAAPDQNPAQAMSADLKSNPMTMPIPVDSTVHQTSTQPAQTNQAAVQATPSTLVANVAEEDTSGKTNQEPSNGEIRKILEMEAQRSNVNRLTVQQGENNSNKSETQSDSQSQADDSQTSTLVNLTDLAASKLQVREAAPSATTHAQAAVDPQDLMNQVVQKADLMMKQNSSEMTLQLKPGFLGKMTIKVMVDESGSVTAQFTTSSQQVKNMLEQNLQTLRQNLEAQGMKVDRAEVNVQLDSGGMLGDFGGRQQELWQRANSGSFTNSSRNYTEDFFESALTNDSSIYPAAFESGISDDGVNYLV